MLEAVAQPPIVQLGEPIGGDRRPAAVASEPFEGECAERTQLLGSLESVTHWLLPASTLLVSASRKNATRAHVEGMIGILGFSLLANHPVLYGMVALLAICIYAITRLEERELRTRFGAAYEAYSRRVPRFIPRLSGRSTEARSD
jgi:hypothetical protein